ncbi:OmpA family protein [Vibrio cidicii]|nr:OmpA family protein [Vibrio cidicii]
MKKLAITISAVLASSGFFSATATAALSDVYVGGKLGYVALEDACYASSPCDYKSFGLGAYSGYNFTDNIAAEVGIDMLGKFETTFSDWRYVKDRLSAISVAPKLNLPVNEKLDAFAKLGAAYMRFGDENDIVATGSLGLEYQLSETLKARAEYQRFQDMSDDIVQDMDTNVFSLGVTYLFGQSSAAPAATSESVVEPRPVEQEQPAAVEPVAQTQPEEVVQEVKEEVKPEPKPEWVTKFTNQKYNQELFATGSSTLSAGGKKSLEPLLEVLLAYPTANAEIVGHTDSTGSETVNQRISEKRAQAVADYLIQGGVKAEQLTVVGAGESSPIASNDTAEGRAQNRRVEVTIPSFEYQELKKTN